MAPCALKITLNKNLIARPKVGAQAPKCREPETINFFWIVTGPSTTLNSTVAAVDGPVTA